MKVSSAPPTALEQPVLRMIQVGVVLSGLALMPGRYLMADRATFPKEFVVHVFALAVAMACIAWSGRIRVERADLLLIAFILLGLLSWGFAAQNSWLALRSVGVMAGGVAVFWVARALGRTGWANQVCQAAAVAVGVTATVALAEAYGLLGPLSLPDRAPGGTFVNRNFLAHYLVLGTPALVAAGLSARVRISFVAFCSAGAAVSAAVVLTRCRAAWLAMLVVLVVGIGCAAIGARSGLRLPRRRLCALLGVGLLGCALAVALPNRLTWRSASPYAETLRGLANYHEGSGRGRLIQYRNTARMVRDHPLLGVGPGNWLVQYPRYASPGDPSFDPRDWLPTNRYPNGDWFGVAAERGIPALLALVAALALGVSRAWRRIRREPGTEGPQGTALLCTMAALATMAAFDPILLQPAPAFLVFALLGALWPAGRSVAEVSIRGAYRLIVVAAILCAGAVPLGYSGRQLAAAFTYGSAPNGAALDRALRLNPGDYRAQMMAAQTWIDRRRCDRALGYAQEAARLNPYAPAPDRFRTRCTSGNASQFSPSGETTPGSARQPR